MAGDKRTRQKASRQARLAAEAAARQRRTRIRWASIAAGGVVVLVGVIVLVAVNGDDGTKVTSGASTTTTPGATTPTTPTTLAASSARGKPCVAVSDPIPAGAPAVPVKEGPPPAKLVAEDLQPGTGEAAAKGATVTVNYIGASCSTGKIFDTSWGKQPATFPLSNVIKGWQDGIPGMKVGGRRLLGIPPAQAYGSAGRPGTINPDETLWFVVELLAVKPA